MQRPNNVELCFEETDFDAFLEKLQAYPDLTVLSGVREHSWGQRVIRFYDPGRAYHRSRRKHGDGSPAFPGGGHDNGGSICPDGCFHWRSEQAASELTLPDRKGAVW